VSGGDETVQVRSLTGAELRDAVADLAAVRMTVFAGFPYLYDGDPAYEEEYLFAFVNAPDAVLVAAFAGERIVGAATASPMAAQEEALRLPVAARGLDVGSLFYFGESVLLPEFRGRGIGHAFFDHREARARSCGARGALFAAVVRPTDHPDRPADYRPLDDFWTSRGYAPVPGLIAALAWKEHDEAAESDKPMQFWMRDL